MKGSGDDEKKGGLLSSRLPRVMIVILAYFVDGSGKPEIEFVEAGPDQAERVARTLVGAAQDGKRAEVFKIEGLDKPAVCVRRADDA
jgi:hypothetical protein